MPTAAQKIPNNPLTGNEVAELTIIESDAGVHALASKLREELKSELSRNALFSRMYTHPRAKIDVTVKFRWSNISVPATQISVSSATRPEPSADDPIHHIDGIRREITVENPNLTRVHNGLPITINDVKRP